MRPALRAACSPPSAISSSAAMVSAQMKPRAKSVWMRPAASTAVLPARMGQARASVSVAVREADQAEEAMAGVNHAGEAGRIKPERLEEFGLLRRLIEQRDLRLDRSRDHDLLGACRGGMGGDGPAHLVARCRARFIDVADIEHRLRAEQVERREAAPGLRVGQIQQTRGASRSRAGRALARSPRDAPSLRRPRRGRA